ncbi:MAG: DUF6624 domain-containing protein [Nonlabens sp.]
MCMRSGYFLSVKQLLFLVLIFLLSSCEDKTGQPATDATGQKSQIDVESSNMTYGDYLSTAREYYKASRYENAASTYTKAFSKFPELVYSRHRIEAAQNWALAQQPDSAFYQLEKLVKSRYTNFTSLTNKEDFEILYFDPRWRTVIDKIQTNAREVEAMRDEELIAQLQLIHSDDQYLRKEVQSVQEKYGYNSSQVQEIWKEINIKDSLNLIQVREILDSKGWLGSEIVGDQGNSTLFLVIQHAPLDIQLQYLPMMREAAARGDANSGSLALLEDRVALRQGKKQIYGSQVEMDPDTGIYKVSPIENPEEVDERRAMVGLGPIADYVSRWDIIWDVEQRLSAQEE